MSESVKKELKPAFSSESTLFGDSKLEETPKIAEFPSSPNVPVEAPMKVKTVFQVKNMPEKSEKGSNQTTNSSSSKLITSSLKTISDLPAVQDCKGSSADIPTPVLEAMLTKSQHPWGHLVFAPHVETQRFDYHFELVAKGLRYATKHLKKPSNSFIDSRKLTLGPLPDRHRMTLVLDLEDTLIHACKGDEPSDFSIQVNSVSGDGKLSLSYKKRPFVEEFLTEMAELYEIIIFAGSSEAVSAAVVDQLDPERRLISHVLHRGHCLETKNGLLIKDLRLLANRKLENLLIVDNLMHSFAFQIENGVPILGFFGESNDQELKYLGEFLTKLVENHTDDVRIQLQKELRLPDLLETVL